MLISPFKMILGAYGKDSLCAVLCRTKSSKGFWKEFQSGSLSWVGGGGGDNQDRITHFLDKNQQALMVKFITYF